MNLSHEPVAGNLKTQLVDYTYRIVSSIHYVYHHLGNGLPEYVYQEALYKHLVYNGFNVQKEYQYHPFFMNTHLETFIKMDMVIILPKGNIIIECKSISQITDKEQFQTFGYMRGTQIPIALLVNFGSFPKAEIQRYYYKDGIIKTF